MSESEAVITIVYGLIGATGALAIVVFAWGFAEYITKIGLPGKMRDPGIGIMEWGVRLILTAVFLILVLKFLERWFG
jgi:hypothetical protein